MPRLLLTAFEPFDGTGINASLEAARAFMESDARRLDACLAVLPVRYGDDVAALEAAIGAAEPRAILHTGQTGGGRIGVERLAVNVRTESDNWEAVRERRAGQRLILEDGPPAYFATLPLERLVRDLEQAGVPVELSNHAGIYMCNHVLYQSLHREARQGTGRRVGFLHLPRLAMQWEVLTERGQPLPEGLSPPPVETLVAAIVAAARALAGD